MKSITVTLNADGTVKLEGGGFKGKECDQAMAFLEEALGLQDAETKKLPEYYQSCAVPQKLSIGK